MLSIQTSLLSAAAIVAVSLSIVGCSPASGEVQPVATAASASAPASPKVEYFGEGFAVPEKALQNKPVEPSAPTF